MFAIGLMSGTSMDGVDAALIETDGTSALIRPIDHLHLPYLPAFRAELRLAEKAVYKSQGRLSPDDLKNITEQSTSQHQNAVNQLLQKLNLPHQAIDVIGYHGQTLLHRPKEGISVIIGNGQNLADLTGIAVVNDFRSADIAAGGQGAPLAPLFHHALAIRDQCIPIAVLNCGGISNITLAYSDDPSDLFAFDTGPGNALIDRLIRVRTHQKEHMDKDGYYGLKGTINEESLNHLHQSAIRHHGQNYLLMPPPKSLDTHDMIIPSHLDSLSIEDAAATLEYFTADVIVKSLSLLNRAPPNHWVLAGGGWHNPVIKQSLSELLQRQIGPKLILQTADEKGWHSQAMEAQLFAWLAVRSLKQLPLSLPNTTGVPAPLTGGCHYRPSS